MPHFLCFRSLSRSVLHMLQVQLFIFRMIHQEKQQKKVETEPSCPSTPLSTAEVELKEALEELSLEPEKVEQKDRKRCFGCNKKVGLLGIECKCGFIFCNAHRLPQNHSCSFNHYQKARMKLKNEIVKVGKAKIEQI